MVSTVTDRSGVAPEEGIKAPCVAATTANITLSGLQTIDAIVLAANDRVVVKDQTDATENGIYVASTSTWARAYDFNDNTDLTTGTLVAVSSGAVNKGVWYIEFTGDLSIGTTSISFTGPSNLPVGVTEYASIYALTQATAVANVTYSVSNFYSTVTGGGGEFYWDTTQNKANANGGTIIDPDTINGWDGTQSTIASTYHDATSGQGNGSGSGCWVRVGSKYTVKDFGATGAGSGDDDIAAIQATEDYAETINGAVEFPPTADYYRCADRLYITDSVSLIGDGLTEIRFDDGLTYGTVATTGQGAIDVLDVTDFAIHGLRIRTDDTGANVGVHLRGCSEVRISGNAFEYPSAADGAKCIVVQRSPNVSQVINVSVTSNQFTDSPNAVLVIGEAAEPPTNILIADNTVTGIGTAFGACIKVDKYTNNCVISNNVIDGTGFGDEGITVEQGSYNCSIVGNVIYNVVDYGIKATTDNPDSPIAFANLLISNNQVYTVNASSGIGIFLDSTGAASDNISVIGNNISTVKVGIRENINNITDLVIANNNIYDASSVGLTVQSDNAIIKNNMVKGAASAYSLTATDAATTGLVITDNIFEMDDGDAAMNISFSAAHGTDTIAKRNIGLRANSERATGTFTAAPGMEVTELYSAAGAVTCTLPDGTQEGQIKVIHGSASGTWNSSEVYVTNHETSDPEVITFANRTDTAVLMWMGAQWITIKLSGATV